MGVTVDFARQLDWATGRQRVCAKWLQLCRFKSLETPWTVARQASLSMGFSRQEYQSGLPFPSPGGLPDPGIEPRSPALWRFFTN